MKETRSRWAALFDWDGVIVDSSQLHELSWEVIARDLQLALPPGHFKRGFGRKNEFIIPEILGWANEPAEIKRLANLKEEAYRELVRTRGIQPLPGVRPWLQTLWRERVRCVIGSSTERKNIDAVLEAIGLAGCFDGIVSGDDVQRGKPSPDIFLQAARLAGAEPARCVVFEDAHVGLEAARAAGMKVIAVTTTHPRGELSEADVVVDKLDELSLPRVDALFST